MKKLILVLSVLALTACGKPLTGDDIQYAGLWINPQTSLLITESGRLEYHTERGAVSTSISMPIRELSASGIDAGFLIFSADFELEGPPAREEGFDYLVVDGEKLFRANEFGRMPQGGVVPEMQQLRPLVEQELERLAAGILQRDYTDYLDGTSPVYQSQFDNAALQEGYKSFSDQDMDLTDWMRGDFILTSQPVIDQYGVMTVEGRYQTSPTSLRFSIDFQYAYPQWKSMGAEIAVRND